MFKLSKRYVMIAIACLVLLGMSGQMAKGQTEEQSFSTLKDEVQKIVNDASEEGDVSVFIGTSDGEIKINETQVYSSASTIKVPILVEGMRQAEQGNLNLDEKVSIDSSDIVGGGGILRLLSDNQSVSIRDLMTLMIIVSDNSATNMLIDRLGMEPVNETCREMGCEHTKLQRYMLQSVTPNDNLTSASDMVKILKAIDTGDIVSSESRDEILRIMGAQKLTGNLPAYRDSDEHRGVQIASKGGSLGSTQVKHDVAIFTLGDSTVYAAVLTQGLSKRTAQRSMAGIGESIMDHLVRTN